MALFNNNQGYLTPDQTINLNPQNTGISTLTPPTGDFTSMAGPKTTQGTATPMPSAGTRMPWEAAPGMTAAQMPAGGAGGSTPDPGSSNPFAWNKGNNPFMQNVSMTNMNGDQTAIGPNSNYLTQDASQNIAKMLGANLVGQNTGLLQGGNVSSPMYGLDFGTGDVQDAGWIATAMNRGDSLPSILARAQAGIRPPMSYNPANAGNNARESGLQEMNWNMSPLAQNLPAGQVSSLGGGKAGIPQGSPFLGMTAATHLGQQGGAKPTGQGQGPGQSFNPFQQGFNPFSQQGFNPFQRGGGGGFGGGFNPFQQGSMSGFGNFANQMPQRRPQFSGYGQQRGQQGSGNNPFSNSFYYPRFM